MSNVRWKPLPGYPGYEINRSAWVRNPRGYVVASGKGVRLFIGGVYVGVKFKRLVALAAEVFGETHVRIPEPKAKPAPVEPEPAPVEEPEAVQEEAAPVAVEESQPEPASVESKSRVRRETIKFDLRINPTHVLPLRDPWADGSIETASPWDLAGVM